MIDIIGNIYKIYNRTKTCNIHKLVVQYAIPNKV